MQVLRLSWQGLMAPEIAETLFISRRTVHGHWQNIRFKAKLSGVDANRMAIYRWALREGLLA